MTVLTEGRHAAEFVLNEASGMRSRDTLKIGASQTIIVGTVLGYNDSPGLEAASAAKSGGNTGNGTLTLDASTPVRAGAKVGVYTVRFTAAATNNGTFRVTDPDGFVLGDVVMAGGAGAFDNDIKFAVADGGTDFAVGDGFDITVTVSDEAGGEREHGALDLSSSVGLAVARAIALYAATTGVGESAKIAGITRDCEVNGNCLEWPAGITAVQKAAAIRQLADVGIIVR